MTSNPRPAPDGQQPADDFDPERRRFLGAAAVAFAQAIMGRL